MKEEYFLAPKRIGCFMWLNYENRKCTLDALIFWFWHSILYFYILLGTLLGSHFEYKLPDQSQWACLKVSFHLTAQTSFEFPVSFLYDILGLDNCHSVRVHNYCKITCICYLWKLWLELLSGWNIRTRGSYNGLTTEHCPL